MLAAVKTVRTTRDGEADLGHAVYTEMAKPDALHGELALFNGSKMPPNTFCKVWSGITESLKEKINDEKKKVNEEEKDDNENMED